MQGDINIGVDGDLMPLEFAIQRETRIEVLTPHTMKGLDPAFAGKAQPGDILVAIETQPVVDSTSMLNLIAALEPGKPAALKIRRNRTEMVIQVKVGKRPRPNRRGDTE